jgi:arylsulfatase A-like enzyme
MDPAFGFGAGFDQYETFYQGDGNALERRTSSVREYLGQFDIIRQIYRQFNPMGAVLEDIPDDADLIDEAIKRFNNSEPPRFLWLHLMESHRPYGTGDQAVPVSLDRKSEAMGGGGILGRRELTDEQRNLIDTKYRNALGRCDDEINRLIESLDGDPTFAFTSDHGEELGEEGYYYHQGYRRRVPETIVTVPAVIDGVALAAEQGGLVDIAPTLVAAQGIAIPSEWHGVNLAQREPNSTLTIAPWHEKATVLWQNFDSRIVIRDGNISYDTGNNRGEQMAGSVEVSDQLEEKLKDLGYVDAG